MKTRINRRWNNGHLRIKALRIICEKGIAGNHLMGVLNIVLRFIGIFQEFEFFIFRRGVQKPDAIIEIKDDFIALVKLFLEPGRANQ